MFRALLCGLLVVWVSGCVTVPVSEKKTYTCELSTDKKVLKVIDVAEATNTYYDVVGLALSPILVPTTAIVSGAYVLINNTYHLGEEAIKCG